MCSCDDGPVFSGMVAVAGCGARGLALAVFLAHLPPLYVYFPALPLVAGLLTCSLFFFAGFTLFSLQAALEQSATM